MKHFGHTFTFQHDESQPRVTVETESALTLPQLLDAFHQYVLACGYTEETVSKHLGCELGEHDLEEK
jgi:hypothetical protein